MERRDPVPVLDPALISALDKMVGDAATAPTVGAPPVPNGPPPPTPPPDSLSPPSPSTIIAQFNGTIRRAIIMPRGEINITFAIPFEHKYAALPVTDYVGISFEVTVARPPEAPEPPCLPKGNPEWLLE